LLFALAEYWIYDGSALNDRENVMRKRKRLSLKNVLPFQRLLKVGDMLLCRTLRWSHSLAFSLLLLQAGSATFLFTPRAAMSRDYSCADTAEELKERPNELTSELSLLNHGSLLSTATWPHDAQSIRNTIPLSEEAASLIAAPESRSAGRYFANRIDMLGAPRFNAYRDVDALNNKIPGRRTPIIREPGPLEYDIRIADDDERTRRPPLLNRSIRTNPRPNTDPKSNPAAQTVGDEQASVEINKLPSSAPRNSNASAIRDVSLRNPIAQQGCSVTLQNSVNAAEAKLRGVLRGHSIDAFVGEYLSNTVKFLGEHGAYTGTVMKEYIAATKSMLSSCYTPVEDSEFGARNKSIFNQLGSLTSGIDSHCTGLLVGSGQYILTARHCFFKDSSAQLLDKSVTSDMWFRPISSKDRFQACAISNAGREILTKSTYARSDQILVRIAKGATKPSQLHYVSQADLKSIADYSPGATDAPTLLVQISEFPLAKLLEPTKFSSGFVLTSVGICAATTKDDGCFVHMCRAIGGGSGSALFVANANELKLVGTHIGGASSNYSDCKKGALTNLNVGTYPNQDLMNAVGIEKTSAN
jgi:hypothetical protein